MSVVGRRRLIVASFVVLVTVFGFCSQALAVPPDHEPFPGAAPGALPAGIACAFAVSIDLVSGDQGQIITFFDHDGNVVRIVGTAKPSVWRITNLDTNASFTFDLPAGQEVVIPQADGSTLVAIHGGAIDFNAPTDVPPGPFTIENVGQTVLVVAADGHTASLNLNGKVTDLCAKVAP